MTNEPVVKESEVPRRILFPGSCLVGLGLLYLTSLYSFLLFHSIAEIFSAVVAFGIFMLIWNARDFLDSSYLVFLGIAYFFVGVIDVVHTLSYTGMGVFPGYDANLPTQLWITARALQAVSLLIAPAFVKRRLRTGIMFAAYAILTTVAMASIFAWDLFPACFVEGEGLTGFKKTCEYIISALLAGSLAYLYRKRADFDPSVLKLLMVSIVLTIASELLFTFYISLYGLSNMFGHLFKIAAFYFVYRAIIHTGVVKPYNILFRKLKLSEEALREERDMLREYIDRVKVLAGLLPICAGCKKIRDDSGYWNQVETYISRHSDVKFTHGMCPDCAKKMFPRVFDRVDMEKLK
ncbi:MAG: hypothetical protein A2X56_06355 [Nitrospirae bacterium GWC2_57_13]|nr:MAG: hypothetical protein A2X56_06355 [Nitrospirae bacterium GWC2_57_13]HAS53209.1 hypothetical protein [Nitrospiraceae bacterium]